MYSAPLPWHSYDLRLLAERMTLPHVPSRRNYPKLFESQSVGPQSELQELFVSVQFRSYQWIATAYLADDIWLAFRIALMQSLVVSYVECIGLIKDQPTRLPVLPDGFHSLAIDRVVHRDSRDLS